MGLRSLVKPESFKKFKPPRLSAPVTRKDRLYYSDPINRGYLCHENWNFCSENDPTFIDRYLKSEPTDIPPSPIKFVDFLAGKSTFNSEYGNSELE